MTDENGDVITRHDYLPYGEEWNEPPTNDTRRFTGKERDSETGLDYFGARYYGAGIGIFTAVDPIVTVDANLADPKGGTGTHTREETHFYLSIRAARRLNLLAIRKTEKHC